MENEGGVREERARRVSAWLVLGPILVLAAVSVVVAIAAHEGDAAFLYAQQHPRKVVPGAVERLVMQAPEPVPGGNGPKAARATCRSGSPSDIGNPCTCAVTYRSGNRYRYSLTVQRDGSLVGVDTKRNGRVSGCCLPVPSSG